MRKRAQRRSKPVAIERIPKHIVQKSMFQEQPSKLFRKNWWIAASLIGIFILVLFFNTYFNLVSGVGVDSDGTGLAKFYLSGPDPYYNMRLVDQTLQTGKYPYYSDLDPLLNYPLGKTGSRAPLFNMMAVGFSRLLTPFMSEIDAVGYAMQFVPSLFGALLIFPVYFLGKTVFNKKVGLMAALFIAIIPIHLGSGHGSAFTLFDHDSFNLLLFVFTFLFLVKSIMEKDQTKSFLYAILGGISVAALTMTWVQAQFIYAVIAGYAIVQMFIDIFTSKINKKTFVSLATILFVGFLVAFPVRFAEEGGYAPDVPLYLCLVVGGFGLIYYLFGKKNIPWTLSMPAVFGFAGAGLIFLYFVEEISTVIPAVSTLNRLREVIFGSGIYGQKVADTIAEANTYDISYTIMSFGPALYWMGLIGFVFIVYYYLKDTDRRDYLFLVVLFLIDMWLTSIAGRFINDMVPLIALFGAFSLWILIKKIDYRQMLKSIKGAGGGLHGLRRGVTILHVFGVFFICFLMIFPNAYLAFDASIPSNNKTDFMKNPFNESQTLDYGFPGVSLYTEMYWVDPLLWLSTQDTDIESPADRPAVISWWDYGFYEVAVGGHPTVADNFQDGIGPASNFHTSSSEQEAVAVWIIRLITGVKDEETGKLPENVTKILGRYFGNESTNLTNILEKPSMYAPSYNTLISPEYGNEELTVGSENAMYHDATEIITSLSDEELTWFYHEIQGATDFSIRYYAVEGYDINIFNVFTYLADKGTYGYATNEDDYFEIIAKTIEGDKTAEELRNMSEDELYDLQSTGYFYYDQERKDLWYESMVYRCYLGQIPRDTFEGNEDDGIALLNSGYYAPTAGLKHFAVEYIGKLGYGRSGATSCAGCPAVVVSKYYEGAFVNGTVLYDGVPYTSARIVVQENEKVYGYPLGINHDSTLLDENGNFRVIAPAGNVTIQVMRYPEMGLYGFIVKSITLDETDDPEYALITDGDAMRRSGSNYERLLGNITINPADLNGYVYNDVDDDGKYNESVDTPLVGITVYLQEIDTINVTTGIPETIANIVSLVTDENGYYNTSDLMPGLYVVQAIEDDFVLHEDYARFYSGENTYDIIKQKPSEINGKVFFDENDNDEYDEGEEISGANVELVYAETKTMGTTTTTTNGSYQITQIPTANLDINTYVLNVKKYGDDGKLQYVGEKQLMIGADETQTADVAVAYNPISVSGTTNKANTSIFFRSDNSVAGNTAQDEGVAKSNSAGAYAVQLQPGSYNVTAKVEVNESNQIVTYSYSGKTTINIGEETKTFDIALIKEEEINTEE